jgi:membrane protease subunit HflK
MTHSGAIAATMMAVASVPTRGLPTSSSCGAISIVVCPAFSIGKRGGGGDRGGDGGGDGRRSSSIPSFSAAVSGCCWRWSSSSGWRAASTSSTRRSVGLVLQFGRYKESTDSGLRWRLPYPIQSHELVNVSGVRTLEIGYRGSEKNKVLKEALMLTDDENIINIQFAVQYILKDPVDYVFNNRHPTMP